MERYDCKVVDLGDYIGVTRYGSAIKTGNPFPRRKKSEIEEELKKVEKNSDLTDTEKLVAMEILRGLTEKQVKSSVKRRTRKLSNAEKNRFLNLVVINFKIGDLFITLTYERENVAVDEASRDYENWVKRMRERYGDFKYLAVRSFQERGTIHFHILANLPRIPKEELENNTFRNIWGHGNVYLKVIYRLDVVYERSPLSKYLVKNLKEFKEDERSFGKRLYLKSKNLVEPIEDKGSYKEMIKKFGADHVGLEKIFSKKFPVKYYKSMEIEVYKKPKKLNEDISE